MAWRDFTEEVIFALSAETREGETTWAKAGKNEEMLHVSIRAIRWSV